MIRTKPKDLAAVGVERVPRVTGTQNGLPELADGSTVDIANVACKGRLLPAFEAVGAAPPPPPQFWPVHNYMA